MMSEDVCLCTRVVVDVALNLPSIVGLKFTTYIVQQRKSEDKVRDVANTDSMDRR